LYLEAGTATTIRESADRVDHSDQGGHVNM